MGKSCKPSQLMFSNYMWGYGSRYSGCERPVVDLEYGADYLAASWNGTWRSMPLCSWATPTCGMARVWARTCRPRHARATQGNAKPFGGLAQVPPPEGWDTQ